MHEDSMETKNLRPSGATLDSKTTKTDPNPIVSKVHSRNGKKREGSGNAAVWNTPNGPGTVSSMLGFKSQQQTPKTSLVKQKGPDKKQRYKAGNFGMGAQFKNDHQVTDSRDDEDVDCWLSERGKKQNLAHMLNMKFQFAPRDTPGSHYWRVTHSSGVGDKGRRLYNHSYQSRSYLNKDQYLQANCQFVVKAGRDYSSFMTDPDLLVPWDSIEQIRIWDSEGSSSCPICLHPPVAARMTRCGHVYCWACLLHFLALSDKSSRPCPICDASVRVQDLKSVIALEQCKLKVDDVVEMRLMKRDRYSLEPQPVGGSRMEHTTCSFLPISLSEAGERHIFSKLLLCTPREVVQLILKEERGELEAQYAAEKDCPESCFILQALEILKERESASISDIVSAASEELVLDEPNMPSCHAGSASHASTSSPFFDLDCGSDLLESDRSRYTSVSSDGHEDPQGIASGNSDTTSFSGISSQLASFNSARKLPQSKQMKNTFYFYQSSDGQPIFLHPINVQMLVRCYGSLEMCPETIQGRIVEADTLFMTEELRNRLRYLGHIPISKQFQIMEISLVEPFVTSGILEEFRESLIEREHRRRQKDREERRRDLEIQRSEEEKWGRRREQPAIRLDSQLHFPEFSPTFDLDPTLLASLAIEEPEKSEEPNHHGPSFAQMLREGKNKGSEWPSISRKHNMPLTDNRGPSQDNYCVDDHTPVPEFRETFSSALSAAFDQAALSIGGKEDVEAAHQSKKGRRKAKQKLLFSNGMNFM